ncbi:lysozyme inhibitor LprI family protein [Luteimonas sp. A534]
MKSKMAIRAVVVAALLAGCSTDQSPSIDTAGAEPAAAQQDHPEPGQQPEASEVSRAHSECIAASDGVTAAMLDCSRAELDRQDSRLNAAYKEAMAATADRDGLRAIQRQWIKDRDAVCAIEDDGGTAATLNHVECLVQETKKRADELGGNKELDRPVAPMHADWFEEVSEESPPSDPITVKVHSELGPAPTFHMVTFLTIQSVVDEVTITGTQLNRGNCETFPYTSKGNLPVTLKFGDEVRVELKRCGALLEANVRTSAGAHAFTFDHVQG